MTVGSRSKAFAIVAGSLVVVVLALGLIDATLVPARRLTKRQWRRESLRQHRRGEIEMRRQGFSVGGSSRQRRRRR